jgi:hypothetical protein
MPRKTVGVNPITVRSASADELPNVQLVNLAAFQSIHESFAELLGPGINALVYPDWRASQQRELASLVAKPSTALSVAVVRGEVVGFVVVGTSTSGHRSRTQRPSNSADDRGGNAARRTGDRRRPRPRCGAALLCASGLHGTPARSLLQGAVAHSGPIAHCFRACDTRIHGLRRSTDVRKGQRQPSLPNSVADFDCHADITGCQPVDAGVDRSTNEI